MTDAAQPRQLRDALERLETQLETPVVPGELAQWAENVQEIFQQAADSLRSQIQQAHAEQLRQMAAEDLGTAARVDQLRQEDAAILQEVEQVRKSVQGLASKAKMVSQDEQRAEDDQQQLVDQGLALVIRIRKQEAAISTWLMEAIERDRGVVD